MHLHNALKRVQGVIVIRETTAAIFLNVLQNLRVYGLDNFRIRFGTMSKVQWRLVVSLLQPLNVASASAIKDPSSHPFSVLCHIRQM